MTTPECTCAACLALGIALDRRIAAGYAVTRADAVVDRVHGLNLKPAAALGRPSVSAAGPTPRRASTARESRE